jgi:hypothetical protein
MGMDISGRKPTTEDGEYFRNTVGWWHPLASYCERVAPEIAERCTVSATYGKQNLRARGVEYWHTNDGGGLNGPDSLALADILQGEIDSGRCESYARLRQLDPRSEDHHQYRPRTAESVEHLALRHDRPATRRTAEGKGESSSAT